MMKENRVQIYTDGACSGNPGPGGFGAIVHWPQERVLELGGFEAHTTNNRMEMTAVLMGLERVCQENHGGILVVTDSKYVIDGITQWIHGWIKRGWKNASRQPVKNRDLWEGLHHLVKKFEDVEWKHIEGHSGHPANERCDEIAVAFSTHNAIELYDGPADSYGVSL